jgi:hypothetical protein
MPALVTGTGFAACSTASSLRRAAATLFRAAARAILVAHEKLLLLLATRRHWTFSPGIGILVNFAPGRTGIQQFYFTSQLAPQLEDSDKPRGDGTEAGAHRRILEQWDACD